MSIEAVGRALEAPLSGNAKVILLGLANHAHPDGTEARPSFATLARYAHCDRQTVRRHLRKLEEDGWIVQTGWHLLEGRSDRRVAVWSLTRGYSDTSLQDDVSGAPERGITADANGVSALIPEPSIEPSGEPRGSKEPPSSPEDAVFVYWTERCGHPQARFTADRKRKVRARLKEGYTVEQLRQAVDGAAVGAFVNDAGHRFDDLELICRNGSKVESFMGRASANGNGNGRGQLKHRTFGGRTWDELPRATQENLKESLAMGYERWDGGRDDPSLAPDTLPASNGVIGVESFANGGS